MKDSFQPRNTREAILDATDRLLARYGYRKMTIDDLAREVGIGKGSVYLHFDSKEEIALSHIDRIIDKLKSNLAKIAGRRSSVEDRIKRMLVERVLYRFDSVQHYSQSLDELLTSIRPKLMERRQRYFQEEARLLAEVIAEGIENGTFRKLDTAEAADTFLLATNSLLPFSLSNLELSGRKDVEAKVKRIANMLIEGVRRT